jgi:hypothetical protein
LLALLLLLLLMLLLLLLLLLVHEQLFLERRPRIAASETAKPKRVSEATTTGITLSSIAGIDSVHEQG